MKRPSFQFYPGDWIRDVVSRCSLASQGLWLRMMCLAHDSDRYGYLVQNGSPIPPAQIARSCGCDCLDQYEALFAELTAAGVPSVTKDGIIYSRRMVQDEKERQSNARRQAKHKDKKSERADNKEDKRALPDRYQGVLKQPSNAPITGESHPSSSASSSSSFFADIGDRDAPQAAPSPSAPFSLLPLAGETEGTSPAPPKRRRVSTAFVKPTIEEVAAYMATQGIADPRGQAELFWGHHDTRGWKTRSGPIVSWKSAVITWKGNIDKFGSSYNSASSAGSIPSRSQQSPPDTPGGFRWREAMREIDQAPHAVATRMTALMVVACGIPEATAELKRRHSHLARWTETEEAAGLTPSALKQLGL